ncbi:Tat pathway signal protein [Brevundimonas sp. S30B]|nr:Tat pathway signal protein [Brevundimonas sp. S30B]
MIAPMERRVLIGLKPRRTGGPTAPPSANTYLRLSTATGTVVRGDGRRGVMSVEVGVDVADVALRTRAEQSQPRLNAAYGAVIQRTAQGLLPAAVPDVDALARALQSATDQVLGRPGARVLLGTVMVV